MESFNEIQVQSDTNGNLEKRVIVQLVDPPSSNGMKRPLAKSGLVRISGLKQLRREDKKLRRDFERWMPTFYQTAEVGNEEPREMRTESMEFCDVASCLQFVKSSDDKRIILILSRSQAQNKNVVAEFEQCPQIALTYCRVPELLFNKWSKRWSFERQFFTLKILSRNAIQSQVQDLDEASQLLLMQIFFTELVLKLPKADEAKEEFLTFCRSTYKDDPSKLEKVEDFDKEYHESAAINWYTRPGSFLFRIVSKACASFDFDTFFKIRFFLRDLYMQLKKLHEEQLTTLLKTDLIVYRGTKMSPEELNHLRTTGELFVTRNFVSTSTKRDVACMFSGDTRVSEDETPVLICMHIDREEVTEKPVAFIDKYSEVPCEHEVLLSMGLVLRTLSCKETNDNSRCSVEIEMVRGKEEQKIEKELNPFHLLAASNPVLDKNIFLKSTQNGQHVEKYCELMSRALELSEPEVAKQLRNIVNGNVQANGEGAVNTNSIACTAKLAAIFQRPLSRWIVIVIAVLIIVAVVTTAVSVTLIPKKNSTATECPHVGCFTIVARQNPSPNHQIESLTLNCSQSLSNSTIIQTVQRTHDETHAHQNQSFRNDSTNMTYIVTPTEIIYIWYLLPGMQIDKESFPHSIQVQFYYMSTSVRETSDDTWQLWVQSVCGTSQHLSGTF